MVCRKKTESKKKKKNYYFDYHMFATKIIRFFLIVNITIERKKERKKWDYPNRFNIFSKKYCVILTKWFIIYSKNT